MTSTDLNNTLSPDEMARQVMIEWAKYRKMFYTDTVNQWEALERMRR